MCTAATYQTKDFYFGRNLDYEFGYGETVTFTPRHYPFQLNGLGVLDQHYAILGMACVQNNYPLYYDAINEKGLCIAGLNFVGNAWYCKDEPGKDNVAQFELIPWLLGRCATVQDARTLLDRMNLVDTPFCEGMPVASLHWMIADNHECITLESTKDGLHVYDNPAGVLTNNPPFPMQLFALNNYMQLSPKATGNHFAPNVPLNAYSRGMGPWVCRGIFRLSRGLYGRFRARQLPLRGKRSRKREPVFPYSRLGRAAARLLRAGQR